VRCKKKHHPPAAGGNFIRLHLLCRLRRDKPTAFWATRRKASLSDSEGNHPKAQEVRGKKKHILPPQAATSRVKR